MLFPKPAASLSGGLLARKGEASPAMRRQAPVHRRVAATSDDMDIRYCMPVADQTANAAKHALTLRLDDDRHFKLRLAVAVRGQSAQQIVTEALDAFFVTFPGMEALAAQLPPSDTRVFSGTNS